MSDMNTWTGIGRVARDGELKYTQGGTAVLNFSMAVNRSIPPKDGGEWKNEASFIDVTVWGKLAESKAQSIVKGKQVAVKGELRQDRWEQDGQARSKLYIVAETIQPLGDPRKKDQAEQGEQPGQGLDLGYGRQPPSGARPPVAHPAGTGQPLFDDDFSDDIPF